MSNITLAIDDDLLRAARIKAVQQGTSVNEICREAIARFAGAADDGDDLATQLRQIAAGPARSRAASGRAAQSLPSRSQLMDESIDERLPTLVTSLSRR